MFSSASGSFFPEYVDLCLMIFFSNSAEYAKNQALSGGVSAILQSGLILENIRRMFFVKIFLNPH